jgi:hypothetical protein
VVSVSAVPNAGASGNAGWPSARVAGVSDSGASAAMSPFAVSVSGLGAATLVSFVLKISKSKMLLANWIDPTMMEMMLAAKNIDLTRVPILAFGDVFSLPFFLNDSGRA